jgi:hypothetical protein
LTARRQGVTRELVRAVCEEAAAVELHLTGERYAGGGTKHHQCERARGPEVQHVAEAGDPL